MDVNEKRYVYSSLFIKWLNFVTMAGSLCVLGMGIWMAEKTGDCEQYFMAYLIPIGAGTFFVSLIGFIGTWRAITLLLWIYLGAFFLILLAFATFIIIGFVITAHGGGYTTYIYPDLSTPFQEYSINGYSKFMQNTLGNSRTWKHIMDCVLSENYCGVSLRKFKTIKQLAAEENPVQSGCCRPAVECPDYSWVSNFTKLTAPYFEMLDYSQQGDEEDYTSFGRTHPSSSSLHMTRTSSPLPQPSSHNSRSVPHTSHFPAPPVSHPQPPLSAFSEMDLSPSRPPSTAATSSLTTAAVVGGRKARTLGYQKRSLLSNSERPPIFESMLDASVDFQSMLTSTFSAGDCALFSYNLNIKCGYCDSCKGGVAQYLKDKWSVLGYVNIAVFMLLIGFYILAWYAKRNATRVEYIRIQKRVLEELGEVKRAIQKLGQDQKPYEPCWVTFLDCCSPEDPDEPEDIASNKNVCGKNRDKNLYVNKKDLIVRELEKEMNDDASLFPPCFPFCGGTGNRKQASKAACCSPNRISLDPLDPTVVFDTKKKVQDYDDVAYRREDDMTMLDYPHAGWIDPWDFKQKGKGLSLARGSTKSWFRNDGASSGTLVWDKPPPSSKQDVLKWNREGSSFGLIKTGLLQLQEDGGQDAQEKGIIPVTKHDYPPSFSDVEVEHYGEKDDTYIEEDLPLDEPQSKPSWLKPQQLLSTKVDDREKEGVKTKNETITPSQNFEGVARKNEKVLSWESLDDFSKTKVFQRTSSESVLKREQKDSSTQLVLTGNEVTNQLSTLQKEFSEKESILMLKEKFQESEIERRKGELAVEREKLELIRQSLHEKEHLALVREALNEKGELQRKKEELAFEKKHMEMMREKLALDEKRFMETKYDDLEKERQELNRLRDQLENGMRENMEKVALEREELKALKETLRLDPLHSIQAQPKAKDSAEKTEQPSEQRSDDVDEIPPMNSSMGFSAHKQSRKSQKGKSLENEDDSSSASAAALKVDGREGGEKHTHPKKDLTEVSTVLVTGEEEKTSMTMSKAMEKEQQQQQQAERAAEKRYDRKVSPVQTQTEDEERSQPRVKPKKDHSYSLKEFFGLPLEIGRKLMKKQAKYYARSLEKRMLLVELGTSSANRVSKYRDSVTSDSMQSECYSNSICSPSNSTSLSNTSGLSVDLDLAHHSKFERRNPALLEAFKDIAKTEQNPHLFHRVVDVKQTLHPAKPSSPEEPRKHWSRSQKHGFEDDKNELMHKHSQPKNDEKKRHRDDANNLLKDSRDKTSQPKSDAKDNRDKGLIQPKPLQDVKGRNDPHLDRIVEVAGISGTDKISERDLLYSVERPNKAVEFEPLNKRVKRNDPWTSQASPSADDAPPFELPPHNHQFFVKITSPVKSKATSIPPSKFHAVVENQERSTGRSGILDPRRNFDTNANENPKDKKQKERGRSRLRARVSFQGSITQGRGQQELAEKLKELELSDLKKQLIEKKQMLLDLEEGKKFRYKKEK